jgi:hypothetical protein
MTIPTPPRSLKIGTIIDKTLGVVELSLMPALVYALALTAINGAVKYFTLEMTAVTDQLVIGLASFAVGVVAAYLLLEAVVQRTGLRSRGDGDVFVPFVLMSILATLGVLGGLILLILPGLVIMARWIIAGPLVVARGDGATRALGESWERTRGAEWPILVAAFALLLPLIAVIVACGVLFDPADPIGIGVSQLFTSATSVVTQAMGVALYGLIVGAPAAAGLAGAGPRT